MFDELVASAGDARGVGQIGGWARVENAACARRLAAMADELERHLSAAGAAEREQWCIDNWDVVAAEIAAAQHVSLGVAAHQLSVAWTLRERLPRVGEVFAAGAVSYRMIATIDTRTRLIVDADALAKVDAHLAAQISGWGPMSVVRLQTAIDELVERYDPAALRRTQLRVRGRHVDMHTDDGSGVTEVNAVLLAIDGDALDARLEAMAAVVCPGDPRTADQRRSDALGALGHYADRLMCRCDDPQCPAAAMVPSAVVVHVVADEDALGDGTVVDFDGAAAPGPSTAELREMTVGEALRAPAEIERPLFHDPGVILGGAMLPAPLLAAKLAVGARFERIVHPGAAPPEPRYHPSVKLAWFVRCRDMTCRFPGCDEPAQRCDIDHSIAYPAGPTLASNLKCLCRKHHLLKTFGGWRDEQHPDGTVVWTSPAGQIYITHPGSRTLFPSLCRPTAPVVVRNDLASEAGDAAPSDTGRTLAMPRRTKTRAQNRVSAIAEERRHNERLLAEEIAERDKPPPF